MSLETIDSAEMTTALNWKLSGEFMLSEKLREQATTIIDTTPFPTTRDEAWKYTRVAKIKNAVFSIQKSEISENKHTIDNSAIQLVFVNGHFAPQLSTRTFPEGLKVLALSEMDEIERHQIGNELTIEGEIFHAINTAYATDGIYIHVSAKMQIEPILEITHIVTGDKVLSNVRNCIRLEAFSNLKVIQHFVAEKATACFTNVISEISVGKNAYLTIDKIQQESDTCFHISTEEVKQADQSNFTINTITLNGGLVRNNLTIAVSGQECETNLNGAYILKDNQHVDNHTVVDHKMPHCNSNELYKGVIDGKATAVFNGKVFVRKDAQKINAFQSNGNVLMSLDATVNSKPELEIYADDVKCSHGSTTGQLDEEAIFYLRARGIGEKAARQLIVGAFVGDVFDKIENEAVVVKINSILSDRFGWV